MRVGLDVSPLERPFPRGVERAVRGLVAALERRGVLEVVRLAPPEGVPLRRWRARLLPERVRALELDGLHSFTSAFPWRGPGRRVQTVHELPWRHGVAENADLAHRLWARLGALRADRVVVPTRHVAADLAAGSSRRAARVRVVPWGVGPPFAPEPADGAIDEVVLDRYRLRDAPFALALGAVRPKKGLERLLHGLAALARIGEPPLHLVVTGGDTPQLRRDLGTASRLGLAGHVTTLDAVDEADLPALLRLATVVPVLSLSEGFGLPVLEALASGTPVVVPAGSAQAEVAGELGFAVAADDPEAVARALARARSERERLRYRLPARASELTWDASAAAFEAVWQELA